MDFSPTEIQNYERCRRMAVYSSRNARGLTPIFSPLHLSVGTIFHLAQQKWITDPSKDLNFHVLDASSEIQDLTIANYTKTVGVPPQSIELLTLHESIDMALSMCANYFVKYKYPLPPEYTLVSAEQKIAVPIPGTPHRLTGRLDGLIKHHSGRLDVLERKTYKSRPNMNGLQTNFQFLAYMWLLQQLNLTDKMPMICYDGVWRRTEPPKGRTFDDLFLRIIITRSQNELDEFGAYLPQLANEMYETYNDPARAFPNRQWRGCFDCQYDPICRAQSRGEKANFDALVASTYTIRPDDTDVEIDEEEAA
jgi:hypothetical protein